MSTNKVNITLSIIVLIFTIFGFVWLFSLASTKNIDTNDIDARYQKVAIDGIKKDIMDLLSERQNASGMPIPEPTNKMGKEDPFSSSN